MSFELKICKKCRIEKSASDFSICSVKSTITIYRRAICKECRKPQQRASNQKYYDENKEKIKTHEINKYHNGGKESCKDYRHNYSITYRRNPKNKQKINQNSNNWQKKKRANDPSFSIRQNVSRSINTTLQICGSSKNGQSFLQYVPWTIDELKTHLETQFESWMNWNNRGNYVKSLWSDSDPTTWTWQIDHIIPQSELPYVSMSDDNFKKCWDLSNLRPYSAKQNLIDGATRIRHEKKAA